jgi:hypothetical protein
LRGNQSRSRRVGIWGKFKLGRGFFFSGGGRHKIKGLAQTASGKAGVVVLKRSKGWSGVCSTSDAVNPRTQQAL